MANKLKALEEETLGKVEKKIGNLNAKGEFDFPPNYSPMNALKSAWLTIHQKELNGQPVLNVVTRTSVINALMDTVLMGLTPAREQVYYISYKDDSGNYRLQAQRSYFGDIALAKRVAPIQDVDVNLIYEDDDVEIQNKNGQMIIANHTTSLENRDKDIRGVYAIVRFEDDRDDKYEIMTKDEIKQSWSQSKTNGNSPAHDGFPGQMAKRTVTRRALKTYINSADEKYLYEGQTPELKQELEHEAEVDRQIEENANKETIDVEGEEPEDEAEQIESPEENTAGGNNGQEPPQNSANNAKEDGGEQDKTDDGKLPLDERTDLEKQAAQGTGPGY